MKEEIKVTLPPEFKYKLADSKHSIYALAETTEPKTFYTDNYRVTASTQLVDNNYELTVEERHVNLVSDVEKFGLDLGSVTFVSTNEDIAMAEKVGANVFVYAGAGKQQQSGTATITATDKDGKKLLIEVTRALDGKVTHTIAGDAIALNYADLGITVTGEQFKDLTLTVEHPTLVQAHATSEGISLAALTATGSTNMLVKRKDATLNADVIVAIVNITISGNKATPTVVKYNEETISDLITGDANSIRQFNGVGYVTATGTAMFDAGAKAVQLRVVKSADTNLYSVTPNTFELTKNVTGLDLNIDEKTTLNIANSSIADAYVKNNKLYVIGKSQGSTDIRISSNNTNKDEAVAHVHVGVNSVNAKVARKNVPLAGNYKGNAFVQIRTEGSFKYAYALVPRTSTIEFNGTFMTVNVTKNPATNEFDIQFERVGYKFDGTGEIENLGTSDNFVEIEEVDVDKDGTIVTEKWIC